MNAPSRLRFRREDRLLRKAEFDRVFEAGRRGFAKGLLVFVAESAAGRSRLGLVTSRRFGGAVARNRARRLVREAFRHERAGFVRPLDLVVLPQAGGFPDRMQEVRAALVTAVQRALRSEARR